MANISLHEAEITGVYNAKESQALLMYAKPQSGQNCQLVFQDVEWWELCSFGVENILSAIDEYDADSLTEAVIDEHDIDEQYVKMVQDEHQTLFVLQASAGLSGWIIAGNMIIKTTEKNHDEPAFR